LFPIVDMTKHIVTHVPKKYMTQPLFRYCGIFQIATIYESRFNKTIDPKSIFRGFTRLAWYCTPKQIIKKLQQLGLPSSIISKKDITLDVIKQSLQNDQNLILMIWHGYNKSGDGFNALKGFLLPHYISVWWYDEVRKWFFVYDSALKQRHAHVGLPVGNMFIPEHIMKKACARAWWWLMSEVAIVV
jgi:hypothetical protein